MCRGRVESVSREERGARGRSGERVEGQRVRVILRSAGKQLGGRSEAEDLLGGGWAARRAQGIVKREQLAQARHGGPRRARQRSAGTHSTTEGRDASATQQTSLQTRQLTREKSDHRPFFLARRTKICCYIDRAGKRDGGKAMAGREEQDGEGEVSTTTRMTSDEGEILMSGTRRRCCGPAFVHSARLRSLRSSLASRAEPGREI